MQNKIEDVREFIVSKIEGKLKAKGHSVSVADVNLIESGVLDSLAFLELVATLESHFDIQVDFNELDPSEFTGLMGLTAVVVKQVQSKN